MSGMYLRRRALAFFGRTAAVIVVAALGTGAASAKCEVKLLAELPIKMIDGLPVFDVQINDKSLPMIADTGASSSTLITSGVAELGLRPMQLPNVEFYGVGGKTAVRYVTLDSLKVGTLHFANVKMFTIDRSRLLAPDEPRGMIGADIFTLADVEFDLAHNMIRLLKLKDCNEGEALYWGGAYSVAKLKSGTRDTDAYSVDVSINKHTMTAQLDSGSEQTALTVEGAGLAGIQRPKSDGSGDDYVVGIGRKAVSRDVVKLESFAFDQEQILNPKVVVANLFGENKEAATGSRVRQHVIDEPKMLLGADFFMAHRILIAKSEGKVYITYSGGPIFRTDLTPDTPAGGGQ